jgi:hypothetical protein
MKRLLSLPAMLTIGTLMLLTLSCAEDITKPTITLTSGNVMYLAHGSAYNEPGFTANDPEDGDLTSQVTVSGTVDANMAKTYTITYSVSDKAGNSATAERKVIVRHTKNSLAGNYQGTEACNPPGSSAPYSCSVSAAAGTEFTITLNNLGNYGVPANIQATLTGENSLTFLILQQVVNGITFTGNGNVNAAGTIVNASYTAVDANQVSTTCTATWNKS